MRSMEMSAKTVEAAVQAACEALGVDRDDINVSSVSYTHLRAHETKANLVCRLLLEKKKPR